MTTHRGVLFVRNYLAKHWSAEKNQDRFSIMPDEQNMERLHVLYQLKDGCGPFSGMQVVFEIVFHEDHPYKAPSIKMLTPTCRFQLGQSICVDGLTAWHPESWIIITSIESIVERFMIAFVDIENVSYGVGFVRNPKAEAIAGAARDSLAWNKMNFPQLVAGYTEQVDDLVAAQLSDAFSSLTTKSRDTNIDDDEATYTYDD